MDNVWHRQTVLMDRSGMGLFPGIALAFGIVVIIIMAITLGTWWSVAVAMTGSVGGAAIVLTIIFKTVMTDDGDNGDAVD